jgi:hypothetical protein
MRHAPDAPFPILRAACSAGPYACERHTSRSWRKSPSWRERSAVSAWPCATRQPFADSSAHYRFSARPPTTARARTATVASFKGWANIRPSLIESGVLVPIDGGRAGSVTPDDRGSGGHAPASAGGLGSSGEGIRAEASPNAVAGRRRSSFERTHLSALRVRAGSGRSCATGRSTRRAGSIPRRWSVRFPDRA